VLPHAVAGGGEQLAHREAVGGDLVGYHGDHQGIPVVGPPGTVAVFTSRTFHRSLPNTTAEPRRAYICQYSSAPICGEDGEPVHLAVPFLRDGAVVASAQGANHHLPERA